MRCARGGWSGEGRGVKESDIRPARIFAQYLELLREDCALLLAAGDCFVAVSCPGCGSPSAETAFEKDGFRYALCGRCESLFISPRPSRELLDRYYRESKAIRFWSTHFYRETADARREKIFRPRASAIAAWLERMGGDGGHTLVDIGAGYGLLLEELARLGAVQTLVGVEPSSDLAAVCRGKGFRVIEAKVEDVADGMVRADIATAFEVLEHVFDPAEFLRAAARLLRPHGLLLFTTLTVSGFDIQILWNHSKSVSPPQHLNLLSLEGIRRLVTRAGLVIEELTTPGQLDVDIVRNTAAEHPDACVPRFVRSLISAGSACREEFQTFLQRHNLSSHARILARVAHGESR
jgi:2-polyprenyl-3-methyl-5-hydroxy-6-metoxy-1,4-benzoquinol methylase